MAKIRAEWSVDIPQGLEYIDIENDLGIDIQDWNLIGEELKKQKIRDYLNDYLNEYIYVQLDDYETII